MAKEKKITVKFFPKKLKSYEDSYEIYCRVIYNKKSTMFSLQHSFSSESIEKAKTYVDLGLEDKKEKFGLGWKKLYLEKIIRKEAFNYGESYSIVGFGERGQFYLSGLARNLTFQYNSVLLNTLKDVLTYNDYINVEARIRADYGAYKIFKSFIYLNLLNETFNVSFNKIFDKDLSYLFLAALYFNAYAFDSTQEIEEQNNVKPTLSERIPLEHWMHGSLDIGQWFLNENKEKENFLNYLSRNPNKGLAFRKVKTGIKSLSINLEFKKEDLIDVIDFYIETNIKSKF